VHTVAKTMQCTVVAKAICADSQNFAPFPACTYIAMCIVSGLNPNFASTNVPPLFSHESELLSQF